MRISETSPADWSQNDRARWDDKSDWQQAGRDNDGIWRNLRGISGNLIALLRKVESWLDARGRGAWIAAMILGFVFVWPVGLGLMAYMIWSKRMFSKNRCKSARNSFADFGMGRPTGNAAFDAYRADTLRRLEEEQQAFETFLSRLRDAKDKAEFDQFMDERSRRPARAPEAAETEA